MKSRMKNLSTQMLGRMATGHYGQKNWWLGTNLPNGFELKQLTYLDVTRERLEEWWFFCAPNRR